MNKEKDEKSMEIKDFVMKETTTVFNIPMFPDRDFAVICSAIRLDRYSSLKSVMSVQLMGWTKDMARPIE